MCVEAFKELENEFFKLLVGMGGMFENGSLTQKVEHFVKVMADKLKICHFTTLV